MLKERNAGNEAIVKHDTAEAELSAAALREQALRESMQEMHLTMSRLQSQVNILSETEEALLLDRERLGRELDRFEVVSPLKDKAARVNATAT